MSVEDRRPVIFLAFANDREDCVRYLRNLPEELRQVRERLETPETGRICEVLVRPNATTEELLSAFRDPRYRGRIAVFHFGGHAGGVQLFMESVEGRPELAHTEGLAALLGHQQGLQLVFLNGCSTQPQVERLLQAGVPAVIATSEAIDDSVATELSASFYATLASGATIATAYAEAVAAVKTRKGGCPQDVYGRQDAVADRWPWELYVRQGADVVRGWSLPNAAGDPLFGLPPLRLTDLPDTPYRHLQWFQEEHAEVFFGRAREIRTFYELVTSPSAAPILLFYGQSGVGKSSMLAAGLLPRLAASHQVRYARRQRDLGLADTLVAAVEESSSSDSVVAAWHAIESKTGQPLVVILDQVEEMYTRPRQGGADELEHFLRMLGEVFANPQQRPRGKVVLGFRKEWLADIDASLAERKLFRSKWYLDHLDRDGIVEIVKGPAQSARLRMHFKLTVEPGLAEIIADDLLEDRDAAVAPTLEVLLTKMWKQAMARNAEAPTFTIALYQDLRRRGLLLDDFIDEQVKMLEGSNAGVVNSGLALDVLAFHTTPLGTAESRTRAELNEMYRHQSAALGELVQRSKDLYLLTDHVPQTEDSDRSEGTRLSHDTLAPLVRRRFKDSDKPGQRARRILENRVEGWRDGKTGNALDQVDLSTVERGAAGMPTWSPDERRLIQASRKRRLITRVTTYAAIAIIVLACVAALYFGQRAQQQAAGVQAAAVLTSATALEDPLVAALVVSSLDRDREPTRGADIAASLARSAIPVALLVGHRGAVRGATFSPDGRRIVTASDDSSARVWNVDGSGVPIVLRHGRSVTEAAFSPDGRRILTASSDGARVWNADGSGVPVVLAYGPGPGHSAAFSHDGHWIVTTSWDGTRVWKADGSGAPVVLEGPVESVDLSPDGRRMVTTSMFDSTARVRNADGSGAPLVLGHPSNVTSAVFSPDGRRVVTTCWDMTARVWNADGSGRPLLLAGHAGFVVSAAFSPDGHRIVTAANEKIVRVWNADGSGTPVELRHPGWVQRAHFSPDGHRVITITQDRLTRVWNADGSGEPLVLAGHGAWVVSAAFSPDSRKIVTASSDSTARVWNTGGPTEPVMLDWRRSSTDWEAPSAAFSSDGRRVVTASADSVVRVWNADGSGLPSVLSGHRGAVTSVVFSPDDRRLLTASADATARVWNTDGPGAPMVLVGHRGEVTSAAFSPDGRRVVTTSVDNTARVWNADGSGAPIVLTGHRSKLQSAAFSPNGRRIVTTSWDSTARVWNADGSGAPVVLRPGSRIFSATFSPDGQRVLTVADSALLWNADGSGKPVLLQGTNGSVRGAIFSLGGRRVVTASTDGTVRVWRTDGSDPPVVLARSLGSIARAVFSFDGRRVVTTTSNDAKVRVWNADGTGAPVALPSGEQTMAAVFSPDGRRVLTTSTEGRAQLWLVTWGDLIQFLRSATSACLSQKQRQFLLLETERQARGRYDACEREHGRPGVQDTSS